MKHILPGALALSVLLLTACNKADDTAATLVAHNTWKVGAASYKAADVNSVKNIITAATTEGGGNTISFIFYGESLPVNGGIYTIKNDGNGVYDVKVVASDNKGGGAYLIMSGTLYMTMKDKRRILDLQSTTAKFVGSDTKANAEISAHIEEK